MKGRGRCPLMEAVEEVEEVEDLGGSSDAPQFFRMAS